MSVGCTELWDHEFVTSKGTHTEKRLDLPRGCLGYLDSVLTQLSHPE